MSKRTNKEQTELTNSRRQFLKMGTCAGALALAAPALSGSAEATRAAYQAKPFEFAEATLADLQNAMKAGQHTARSIAESYLARIAEMDKHGPAVNAIIELNPEALAIAEALDRERKEKGARGPLHGIPVLINDYIDTVDMMLTTAVSLALLGSTPPKDAFIVERLRAAGAVLLGKTNLSEWANFRSTHSTSGWSGRGGQTRNPYALDRNPCGSSSGSGAAASANFAAIAVGTETDGSVVCPSSTCGLVGIKPTLGLVSRAGIIPIAHSQDTAGPMARTVADATILLGVLAGIDARDAATAESRGKGLADYTKFLDAGGLKGARLGVARKSFGFNDRVDKLMQEAIDVMKRQGAEIIDPADIPTSGKFDDSEFEVLLYEFKADLNAYLATLGAGAPVHSLKEIIAFNEKNVDKEMPYFGQEIMLKAEAKGPLTDAAYRKALAKNLRMSRTDGLDAVMTKHKLDALIAPTGGPSWKTDLLNGDHFTGGFSTPTAVAGYPHITVPAGFIFGLPVGISFAGRAWSEPMLIKLAYAYEQATKHRRAPQFLPNIEAI
ncbi:MAG: amidase [Blastocatellia bacterium]